MVSIPGQGNVCIKIDMYRPCKPDWEVNEIANSMYGKYENYDFDEEEHDEDQWRTVTVTEGECADSFLCTN